MTSAFLLAGQRIEVDVLIRDSTLNPSAFFWLMSDSETTSGLRVTRLQYGGDRAGPFFQFDLYRHAHYAVYSWDGTEARQEHITGPWPRQVLHVARWLAHLADQKRRRGGRAPYLRRYADRDNHAGSPLDPSAVR